MAADGRIVIDVILDDGSVARGIADIDGQFSDLDRNGSSRLANIGGGIKNLAKVAAIGATAVVGIGAAIGGLAAPLVKAAANVQALNAQFSQVFGDAQGQAQSTVDKLGADFGMLPDRIKPAFTQMTSMFKGLGLDTNAAMGEAEKAVTAVADAAAFYDMSFNDANAALNSFIKGNYEGGEAIGLFANETQLASYAVKDGLIGATKEWASLDEATKQATRLEYALAMQNMAGATGQATRESDSLENQLGNLNQAWENLKALLGGPLLEPAIQGIKWLTELIKGFDVTLFLAAFENITAFIGTAFETIKQTIQTAIDFILPFVQERLEALRQFWDSNGQAIITAVTTAFETVKQLITDALNVVVPFVQEQLAKLLQFWSENGEQIIAAVKNAFETIKAVIDFIMPAVLFVIDYIWTAIKNVISGALDVIMGLIKVFSGLFTGDFSKMWEGVKQLFMGAIDLILGWMSLTFLGGIRTLLVNLSKASLSIVKGMWDDIVKTFINLGNKANGAVNSMVSGVVNYFKNLLTNAQNIFGTMRTFGASTFEALKTAVLNSASKLLSGVKTSFTNMLNAIKTTMGTLKTEVSNLWGKVVAVFKPDALVQVGKDIVNGLIKGIGDMFGGVKQKVEALAALIPEWAKKILGIASPSKVFKQIGLWTGEGMAIGLNSSSKMVNEAMSNIGDGILAISNKYQKEHEYLIDEYNKKNENKNDKTLERIYKIQNNAAKKKRKLTKKELQDIALLEAEYRDSKLKAETEFDKKYLALVEKSEKDYLEVIKNHIADKKSLDQLSIIDEAAIWEQSLELFAEGSKERIEAQRAYKAAVETVSKEILSINQHYQQEIQKINDNLLKAEQELNQQIEAEHSRRYNSYMNFAGTFEEFTTNFDVSSQQLIDNMLSQVIAINEYEALFKALAARGVSDNLLNEISELGVKALPQLLALVNMTDDQLSSYENLYGAKSRKARELADAEIKGMREDADKRILELRNTASEQLDKLQLEWDGKIKGITKATSTELSNLQQIGEDAGTGLLNGLASMESPLINKARQIANAIKATIQSALDIHSPSRWMRDFVAGNLAKGFEIGVDKNAGTLSRAAEQMGELIKPGIINPLRGVRPNLGMVGTTGAVNNNSSNSYKYDQSRTINAPVTIQGGGNDERAVNRALRRLQFMM